MKADHWVLASPVEPIALASGHTYSNDRPIHSEGFLLPGKGKSCSCKEFGLRGQGLAGQEKEETRKEQRYSERQPKEDRQS